MAKLHICICIDSEGPANYSKFKTWDKIHNQLEIINSEKFRKKFKKPLVLNWFITDWTGWSKENPYGRDLGFNKIYANILKHKPNRFGDGVYWHYHHPFSDGSWRNGGWNSDWLNNNEYEKQLTFWLIERKDVPLFYRAGGTIETNEQSSWLEKFIPFDFSSRAKGPFWNYKFKLTLYYLKNKGIVPGITNFFKFLLFNECKSNPLWNWNSAPDTWEPYNPSKKNYQLKGEMKRTIFRCLDIKSSSTNISDIEIQKAIARVNAGKDTIISVFSHDYYNLIEDMDYFFSKLNKQLIRYPNIDWGFSNCESAVRNVLNLKKIKPFLQSEIRKNKIELRFKESFGDYPIVCIKSGADYSKLDNYKEVKRGNIKIRTYETKNLKADKIGIALIDNSGNKLIKVI